MTGNYALLLVAQQMAELARNSKCGLSRQMAGMTFLQHTRLCMFNPCPHSAKVVMSKCTQRSDPKGSSEEPVPLVNPRAGQKL